MSDLLTALAVAGFAVAVGIVNKLPSTTKYHAAAHVGWIVRAGVADDRRDLPNVRFMPSHLDNRKTLPTYGRSFPRAISYPRWTPMDRIYLAIIASALLLLLGATSLYVTRTADLMPHARTVGTAR